MVRAVDFINQNLELLEGEHEQNMLEIDDLIYKLQDERFRNTIISILKSMLHRFNVSEMEQSKKLFLISPTKEKIGRKEKFSSYSGYAL